MHKQDWKCSTESVVLQFVHNLFAPLRRALDLSLALCNESNIRGMMKELLAFLATADMELKTKMVTELLSIAEKYSPNKRWHIETVLQILEVVSVFYHWSLAVFLCPGHRLVVSCEMLWIS